MHPFTDAQYNQLLRNGKYCDQDHRPVALLFLTNTRCVWLINEINPDYPDEAFGLCDLGMGSPELGYVSIEELILTQSDNDFVLLVNNPNFKPAYPMSVYYQVASEAQRIVNDPELLKVAAANPKPR